ncbi:MAG: hypothetical protein WKG01_25995 [Kofleriaceae bacterium]
MRRVLLAGAGVLGLAVAIHVPGMWTALGADAKSAFCPFGAAPRLATRSAPTTPRPALGFTLDVTTRSEIDAWAQARGVTCQARRGGGVLECEQRAALATTTLWFRFAGTTLAGIQTSRRTTADGVATAFAETEAALTTVLGDPSRRQGDPAASALARGALRQAMVEYRAPAYRAVVRATNMGDGFVLTESYAN